MELERSEDGRIAVLPEDCLIENATDLKEALLGVLSDEKLDVLDASRIKRADLSGLQLLLAVLKAADQNEHPLSLRGPYTPYLEENLAVSGYGVLLDRFTAIRGDDDG